MRPTPLRLQTLLATLSFSGAALSAELAWLHGRSLHLAEPFCGVAPQAPHCGWCVAAVALALSGVAALVHGRLSAPAPQAAVSRAARRPK